MPREAKEKSIPAMEETSKTLEECKHDLRIDSLCAICGKELGHIGHLVPVLHTSDKLLQTVEVAETLQRRNNRKLKSDGKMILIIDLDQTILHTTTEECECDFRFTSGTQCFYVKLRPHLCTFLEAASKLFEMHVYTMGTREYAKIICGHIDSEGRYFGSRVVTRSENFNELRKSIGRITCISKNVVILDDRADVWEYSENLILIRPFWYHDKVDINDPGALVLCRSSDADAGRCSVAKCIDDGSGDLKESLRGNSLEKSKEQVSSRDAGAKCPLRELSNAKRAKLGSDAPSMQDNDLLRLLRTLRSVHRKFFATGKHVKRLLRLKFLRRTRIAAHPKHHSLIRFSGAILSFDAPEYVVEDEELATRFQALNVQVQWLNECIYQRRLVSVEDYVISSHGGIDEYQKELEDEFFGP